MKKRSKRDSEPTVKASRVWSTIDVLKREWESHSATMEGKPHHGIYLNSVAECDEALRNEQINVGEAQAATVAFRKGAKQVYAVAVKLAIMALIFMGCAQGNECQSIPTAPAVTATRASGCGEPDADELLAIFETPAGCLVERTDEVCSQALEVECEPSADHVWEWRGTVTWDGDGHSGYLERRELIDGSLCAGTFLVEARP